MDETKERLPHLEKIDQAILGLRWLTLVLVLALSLFDRSREGVIIPTTQMVLAVAGYNVLIFFLAHHLAWLRRLLNVLALDTVVATVATYLTGGFHSSFFIVYFLVVIGAAFHLSLTSTMVVALTLGLIHVAACFVSPAGVWTPFAIYMLAAKFALLLIVAVLCGLLLEQLRREHRETQRERALAARLSALNELFQQLSASLDLDHVLQMVARSSRHFLDADSALILLREEGDVNLHLAAADGVIPLTPDKQYLAADDALVAHLMKTGQPYVVEDAARQPTGFTYPLLTRSGIASFICMPLFLKGEAIGILCVGKRHPTAFSEEDVSLLQALGREAALAIRNARLYEAERRQVEQLRALERLQASFVSSVSHELRTPLTCIKTSVDLLQEMMGGASGAQAELVRTIAHHTDRLQALVADLLEITRLEARQLTLSPQPTDLRTIVERVAHTFAPLLEKKGQTIALELPPQVSLVSVDRRRIEQVLTNLLSNAHKFTPKGGHIAVGLAERDDCLEVSVSDDGPGIPPEEQERIFDKFYVVADGRSASGVGLGLYIARQLVELHGGRIWVESTPGQGSTFRFTLPKNDRILPPSTQSSRFSRRSPR